MASFIPNFNAPSQNYGNILNMSYRRGMDPRKRRRIASGRSAGTRVITNPDGTQVSVAPRTAPPDRITDGSEFQDAWSRERDQYGNLRGTIEFNNAAAAPAGTKIITNPDGTQVSVTPKSSRESKNIARRQVRAKRVAEVAAGQKRTKPSDILMSTTEQKSRQMTRARSLADQFYENQFAEAIGQARARNRAPAPFVPPPAPFVPPSETPEGRAAFQAQMESQWQASPQRAILEQGRLAQENISAWQDEYSRRDAVRAAQRAAANRDVFRAQQGVMDAEAAQRRSANEWADTQIQNTLNQPSGMFGNLKPSDVFEAAAMSPAIVPYTLWELLKRTS